MSLSTLARAVRRGQAALLRDYLAAGGDANAADGTGATLLHEAAHFRRPAIVRLLLSAGADVNAKDHYHQQPLHVALDNTDDLGAFGMVTPAGFTVRAPVERPAPERKRLLQTVALLLDAGADANPPADPDALAGMRYVQFPLWRAAEAGDLELARMLLAHGAAVDARTFEGETPLYRAVIGGEPAMVRFLLEQGADANVPVHTGNTPLLASIFYVSTAVWKHEESPAGRSAPAEARLQAADAIRGRYGEILSALVAGGADVNQPSGQVTPAFCAITHLRPDLLARLIAAGADLGYRNDEGNTALHYVAARHRDAPEVEPRLLELARVLLDAGMARETRNRAGKTARDLAIEAGFGELSVILEMQSDK